MNWKDKELILLVISKQIVYNEKDGLCENYNM